MKLSVIIPAYNEEATIVRLLEKVHASAEACPINMEVIVVDDRSDDATRKLVEGFCDKYNKSFNCRLLVHNSNMGKGAAIHTGIRECSGEYIVIQDADLEYDPSEYPILLDPMLKGFADVVYGSRFIGGKPHRILFFWHSIGNKILTFMSNAMTNLNLTDMETCYKMFRADVLKSVDLKEKRFGFEPEVTAKIAKIKDIRIYEVGISYYGRTFSEGKKISWKDGLRALYCVFRYR